MNQLTQYTFTTILHLNCILKTHPSIESLYYVKTSYYDTIINAKISQQGEISVYKVSPNNHLAIWGGIGFKPNINDLPYDYIALISGSDTTVLDSKEKIIEQAKQMNKKRDYYIKIKK